MSCTLSESCKIIIDSKDKEIQEKDERIQEKEERIEELEAEIEEYETKDKLLKVFLIIQSGLLMIAFQIWD